ncbi:iron-dicitrate transporter ATP-binding subunit [Morganella morganii]|nr:iron-dicitrate transporter ATP-binding subunit [Morganella morganii]
MLHVEHLSAGILQDLSLTLPRAQCTAICGPSGSGKNHITELHCRLSALSGLHPARGCSPGSAAGLETPLPLS